jgi:hypothetical protein
MGKLDGKLLLKTVSYSGSELSGSKARRVHLIRESARS